MKLKTTLLIDRDNWQKAYQLAAASFATGWIHYRHCSHFFSEAKQQSVCGRVGRNGLIPDNHCKPFAPCRRCLTIEQRKDGAK